MLRFLFLFVFYCFQVVHAQDKPLSVFYIEASIIIDKEMTWEEIGVGDETAFTDVIKTSWKAWAEKNFLKFDQVDISSVPPDATLLHKNSNLLKWTSVITKKDFDDYELSAQFVLTVPKTNEVLLSHNFPEQKILIDFSNKKASGSKLASLIYNLLNSQTEKIKTLTAAIQEISKTTAVVIPFKGKLSLSEMLEIKTVLEAKFKDAALTANLKNFTTDEGSFFVKANLGEEKLHLLFQETGKFPLNEQKLLLFNKDDKSFAILPKEQNN